MKRLRLLLLAAGFTTLTLSAALARVWTSTDGRSMEADFVSVEKGTVTLNRAGKKITLGLDKLSEDDQKWIASQAASPAPATPAKPVTGDYAPLLTGAWALSTFKTLPYAFYGAKDLDGGKTYPLVVALHGKSDNNENGKQTGGWMDTFTSKEHYAKNPCLLLAPLCYQPYGGTGGGWNDKPGTEVLALVQDLVKNLPIIDKKRIYIIGYSMGGFGTCHLINSEPRLFAAGIPVAGYGSPGTAGNLKRVPLWLFQAVDDTVVKPDGARALAKAMGRVKTFKYTEFPTGGHGIIGKVFDDEAVHEWLFQQTR